MGEPLKQFVLRATEKLTYLLRCLPPTEKKGSVLEAGHIGGPEAVQGPQQPPPYPGKLGCWGLIANGGGRCAVPS